MYVSFPGFVDSLVWETILCPYPVAGSVGIAQRNEICYPGLDLPMPLTRFSFFTIIESWMVEKTNPVIERRSKSSEMTEIAIMMPTMLLDSMSVTPAPMVLPTIFAVNATSAIESPMMSEDATTLRIAITELLVLSFASLSG